jgi:hypothetical protein
MEFVGRLKCSLPRIWLVRMLGAALLAAPVAANAKPDSVPDWVRTAAGQALPSYSPETNAVVLLDDVT